MRATRSTGASRILAVASIVYVVAVIAVRLLPSPWPSDRQELPGGVLNIENWFATTTWAHANTREFSRNVLLFVPIGLIVGRYVHSWGLRILAPILLAFVIEAIQLPLPYRVSDPRDIAANTLGALIGIAIVWIIAAHRRDVDSDPDRAGARVH